MEKINLELKEAEGKVDHFIRYFKVVADEPTKSLIRKYINKIGSKYESKRYITWNLKEDILDERPFASISFNKKEWLEELEYLKKELQRFANKEEKITENIPHNEPNINKSTLGSVLKSKEEPKKYTGYTVKLDLTDVENTFRNLIEEYTTELNKPKYIQGLDFVKILDSIKEEINNKNITVVDCMAFVSDLNDYLTDLVAGIYNA